ncbi:NTF2 fold immunity protein [Flaviaesturariibacter amylovorans]|uniref:NTF2 fold domain-containing protein n=1 Tax=Flaviaesturariibacter amylovorans TaxID=1084520 RepID=A0ABP8HVC4_9BACT
MLRYAILFAPVVFLSGGVAAQERFHQNLEDATRRVQSVLHDTVRIKGTRPVRDTAAAIALAESVLFKTYGQKEILRQRPYDIFLVSGAWYICGTIPKGMRGGTFECIVKASDGAILQVTHSR